MPKSSLEFLEYPAILIRVLQPLTSDHSLEAIYRDKSVHREAMELLKIIYLLLSASYTPGGLINWYAFQVILSYTSYFAFFLMDLLH